MFFLGDTRGLGALGQCQHLTRVRRELSFRELRAQLRAAGVPQDVTLKLPARLN